MPDQGVVDAIQIELFSPLETLSLRGLKLIGLLPLTGASLYGSFGSTSRHSLTSTSFLVPLFRSTWCRQDLVGSDGWWAALDDYHPEGD